MCPQRRHDARGPARWAPRLLALWVLPTAAAAQPNYGDGFENPPSALACPGATLLSSGSPVAGAIDPAGQRDYFRVNAAAGQWTEYRVVANPDRDPDLLDSVLTLLADDGIQRVARNDDDVLGTGVDSALVHRSPGAATYCAQLEDYSSWASETPEGGPTYLYDLDATAIDFQQAPFNLDTEPNESTAAPQTGIQSISSPGIAQLADLAGVFGSAADVDVYRINSAVTAQTLELFFTPTQRTGYGGTAALGLVDIVAGDGITVLGRLDVAKGAPAIRLPAIGLTNYHVYVHAPPGALGANPFYYLRWRVLPTANPHETSDIANDLPAGAQALTPVSVDGATRYFFGGNILAGNADWWSFEASVGQSVDVSCASAREGSGVGRMTITMFRDPLMASLQSEGEVDTANLRWSSSPGVTASRPAVTITTTGTHHIRVTSVSDSPTVTDRHYNCGLTIPD